MSSQGECVAVELLGKTHQIACPQGQEQALLDAAESAELTPATVARFLLSLKLAGMFDDINGVIIGRHVTLQGQDPGFDYRQGLNAAFGGCLFPVIIDADIGHIPPNLNLV